MGGVRQPQPLPLPPLLPPSPQSPQTQATTVCRLRAQSLPMLPSPPLRLMRKSSTQAVQSHTPNQNIDAGHSDPKLFFSTSNVRRTPVSLSDPRIHHSAMSAWSLLPFTPKVRAVEITRPTSRQKNTQASLWQDVGAAFWALGGGPRAPRAPHIPLRPQMLCQQWESLAPKRRGGKGRARRD